MPENNFGIDELFNLAIERCSLLMENTKVREIILSDDDHTVTLAKGYFQGFYEAMQMVNTQIKLYNQGPITSIKIDNLKNREGK